MNAKKKKQQSRREVSADQTGEGHTVRDMMDLSAEEKYVLETAGPEGLAKASQAAAWAVRGMASVEEVEKPKGLKDWLGLYSDLVWAYAGIYAIASTIAQLEIELVEKDRESGEETIIESHKVLDVLRKPNDTMTGYQLKEALVVNLECVGNAYLELVYGTEEERLGRKVIKQESWPVELWPLRPDRVEPVPRKDGHGVEKWKYKKEGRGDSFDFRPEFIAQFSYLHPTKDWFGQGSLFAALPEIQQEKQMAEWNLDFFKHGTVPEGVLTTDKMVSRTELKRLGEDIKRFLQGQGRTILILSKNMKWQPLSVDPKDIDFLAGRKENRRAILASLGVPPVKVGELENAKYDNFRLQQEVFHRDTIIPKLKVIESCFDCFLLPRFSGLDQEGRDYYLRFDRTPLLKEDEDRLVKRFSAMFDRGWLTPNEARQKLGLEKWPDEVVGGDSFYMSSTLQPVGEPSEESLAAREEETAKRLDQMEDLLRKRMEEIKEDVWERVVEEASEKD